MAIGLSIVLDGSVFWLKRVGWIYPDQHNYLITERQEVEDLLSELKNQPLAMRDRSHVLAVSNRYWEVRASSAAFLNQEAGGLRVFKFSNEFVLLLFSSISLVVAVFRKRSGVPPAHDFAAYLFVGMMVCMGLVSLFRDGMPLVFAGLYSLSFLFALFVSRFVVNSQNLRYLSRLFGVILLVQLFMSILELTRGVPIYSSVSVLGDRAVGTFGQPISLGVFAVVSAAFLLSTHREFTVKLCSIAVAALLAVFSGSGTAILALGVLAGLTIATSRDRRDGTRSLVFGLFILLVLCIAMVLIVDRSFIDSGLGRIQKLTEYFSSGYSFVEYAFGRGLGQGTNTATLIASELPTTYLSDNVIVPPGDSTPYMLIAQFGIVGCLFFYWILFRAAVSDLQFRNFYIVVFISSLFIQILEVFPLNILLGLVLGNSWLVRSRSLP